MYRPRYLSPCCCASETCQLCGILGGPIEVTRYDAESGMAAASLRDCILGKEGARIVWWKKYRRRDLVKTLGKTVSLSAHTWARVTALVALPGPRGILDRLRYEVFVEMAMPWIKAVTKDAEMCIGMYARLLDKRKSVSNRQEFEAFVNPLRDDIRGLITRAEIIADAADKFLVSCVHENVCPCCGLSFWTLFNTAKPPLCSRKCQQTTGSVLSVFEANDKDECEDDDEEDGAE